MQRGIRIFLQSLVILFFLRITLQAQPVQITNAPENVGFLTEAIGDFVYFISGNSLWRTDGTEEGTIPLKTGFNDYFRSVCEFNGMLIFISGRNELWRSDGTPSGTIQLISKNALMLLPATTEFLFFKAEDLATGVELYRTDGTTAGTMLIKDILPGAGDGFRGVAEAGTNDLFFAGNDGTSGTELWKTDGTPAGTQMVKDIQEGAGNGFAAGGAFEHNNRFYFTGNTVEAGSEPWVSDGTAKGTLLLKDIVPGPLSHQDIEFKIGNNETVYFLVYKFADVLSYDNFSRGAGSLWKTMGTPESSVLIETLDDGGYSHHSFLVYHDKIYFFGWLNRFADGGDPRISSLLVTDGTEEGTYSVFSLRTYYGGIEFFGLVNNYLLFYGTDDGWPTALIRSDGTREGTKLAAYLNAGSPFDQKFPHSMTKVDDLVFYADHEDSDGGGGPSNPDDYFQLMQSDAVTAQSVRSIHGGSFADTRAIMNFNGKVLFTTGSNSEGSTDVTEKLWIYDPGQPAKSTTSFTLVNADTNEDMQELAEGDVVVKPATTNLNIRYNPAGTTGSVIFEHQGLHARLENRAPYSLGGDLSRDYFIWFKSFPGVHTVSATAYSESDGKGTAAPTESVTFTIVSEEERPGFTLVNADTDKDIRLLLDGDVFARPSDMNITIRYNPVGFPDYVVFKHNDVRVRKEMVAPYSLAGDHSGNYFTWGKATAGAHKVEATPYGTDGTPGATLFVRFTIEQMDPSAKSESFSLIDIYPNPAESNLPELTIAGYDGLPEVVETEILIMNMAGRRIFEDRISCGGSCTQYLIQLQERLPAGLYLVNMKTNGFTVSKRLMVK